MMAFGYYEQEARGGVTTTLCFNCAVKRVVSGNGKGIHLEVDDNEMHQCDDCKGYTEDRIYL